MKDKEKKKEPRGKLQNQAGEKILRFCNFGDCGRVAIEHIRSVKVIKKDWMTLEDCKSAERNGNGRIHNEYRCGYHRQLKMTTKNHLPYKRRVK